MIDQRTLNLQKPINNEILKHIVDPKNDIMNERNNSTFNSKDLELILIGDLDKYNLRKKCISILKQDSLFYKNDRYFLSREQLYKKTLAMQLKIHEIASKMENPIAAGKVMRELIDEPGSLDLHAGMFIPTIMNQGNDDQKKYWLPLALKTKIIGTYAQTELGHGTFIRGLETTSTYDVVKDEFIIHSPSVTSTKWWPGGLGKTATHVIVMAQLFINRTNYGPHPFIVQIRDLSNHQPLTGIQVGDIGNKLGYNAVDNGFLRFDHVRIPRNNMLMKYSKVSRDGTYYSSKIAKVSYGTMVFVRADIVINASLHLQKALTIAIRYNSVRRQSNRDESGIETKILDYQHSQRTLFPLLSTSFALHFTGKAMKELYFKYNKLSNSNGNFSMLPELHAITSGLKAVCTWKTKHGIELCRLSCGGHGFMHLSGIPHTEVNYTPQVTYEGDNNVLCLQTAKYLLKIKKLISSGSEISGYCSYMTKAIQNHSLIDINSINNENILKYLNAFEYRVNSLLNEQFNNIINENTFQENMIDWIKISKAHCEYIILDEFIKGVDYICTLNHDKNLHNVMYNLVSLYALTVIEDNIGDYLKEDYFNKLQIKYISNEIKRLLKKIRPNAVTLVDSFGFDDYFLNSALGRYDGDVYNELYDWVKKAPMNNSIYGLGYNDLLKPRLSKL